MKINPPKDSVLLVLGRVKCTSPNFPESPSDVQELFTDHDQSSGLLGTNAVCNTQSSNQLATSESVYLKNTSVSRLIF